MLTAEPINSILDQKKPKANLIHKYPSCSLWPSFKILKKGRKKKFRKYLQILEMKAVLQLVIAQACSEAGSVSGDVCRGAGRARYHQGSLWGFGSPVGFWDVKGAVVSKNKVWWSLGAVRWNGWCGASVKQKCQRTTLCNGWWYFQIRDLL